MGWVFTGLWILWGVWFLAVEVPAIVRKERGDTLSEHVWSWFCLRSSKKGMSGWCYLRRFLFYAFWVWLSVHFLSGGAVL